MKPNKHLASLALLFLGFVKALGQNWDKSGTDLFTSIFQVTQRYTLSRRFCPMTTRQSIRLSRLYAAVVPLRCSRNTHITYQ